MDWSKIHPLGHNRSRTKTTLLALVVKPNVNERHVEEKRASLLMAYRLRYEEKL